MPHQRNYAHAASAVCVRWLEHLNLSRFSDLTKLGGWRPRFVIDCGRLAPPVQSTRALSIGKGFLEVHPRSEGILIYPLSKGQFLHSISTAD
jgi:hypothetical protein